MFDEEEFKPLLMSYNKGDVLKITLHEYSNYCGDGCCYNYGTITKVNGVELPCHNSDSETMLRQVLEHLGYKVEIDFE